MNKPLNENLQRVFVANDSDDLIPIMDAAGIKFSELINAVAEHKKAGHLTLKIVIKPSTAGTMAVKAEVNIKKPQGVLRESLLWATPEGNLIDEDPRQTKFDFKPTAPEPVRELKAVNK